MTMRPTIQHVDGSLPYNTDQTIQAIVAYDGADVVRWSGGLYRIHVLKHDQEGPVSRPKGSVVLVPVDGTHLVELATLAASHLRWNARQKTTVDINCPRGVAEAILARGHWPEFPELTGIIEAATLDLNGNEISAPGHHVKTGLYVATSGPLPKMKGLAGSAKGKQGIKVLLDFLRSFPFVSDADKSAALALIMTALLRRLMPSAPMFAATAPSPGTGKTLLFELASIIATGHRPAVLSMGADEAEFSKRIHGALLAGDLMVLIDNVPPSRPIGNEDVLNQLLSQPVLRVRILGSSGMVTTLTNALVGATGNNLSVVGDGKRRTALIRLDAGLERPEQREFDGDILADALSRRDELIRGALEISKSYFEAGCPKVDAKPYGSFADWDRMVRRPLIWHGLADPLLASEGLRDQDPDMECMRALFAAWHVEWRNIDVTASEVCKAGVARISEIGPCQNPELYDALQLACSEKINSRRLGYWLRGHRDRILDGMQLVQAGGNSDKKVATWRVVKL